MFEFFRDLALKILGAVVPLFVSWFYKPEKIAANLKFRVRGDGDGVSYECGELPGVRIWFLVSNLSPFNVEIDRLRVQVAYGAVIGEAIHIQKHVIAASREEEFLVEASLNERQVAYIQKNLDQKFETKLYVNAYVNSRVHNFELTRIVETRNVRLVNCGL